MSTPLVRAVLVTDAASPHLQASLAAIAASQFSPHAVEIVVVGDATIELPAGLTAHVTSTTATTYADAVNQAIASAPAKDGELVWLLHDDLAPAPDALGTLVATMTKRHHAAVVGGAHVRWSDSSRLVNVGTTVSRLGARRVGIVVEDDINQGQHDWRDDVLAVSLAGALVRRQAWDEIGGIDQGYQGFGSSLEFCRRAWVIGHDVVVEPRATLRHAQESLYGRAMAGEGKLTTHVQRRVGEWHHAFAWANPAIVLLLAVTVPFSVATRILLRLAQSAPSQALAELIVPLSLAARLPAIVTTGRQRRRCGPARTVPASLFATPRQVIDSVRHKEFGASDKARATLVPSEMERNELMRAAQRHRRAGAVAVVVGLAASLAIAAPWVKGLLAGDMLTSSAMGVSNITADALWSRVSTGWADAGFGGAAIDGFFAALMLPAALAPGSTSAWIGVFLALSVALATVSAWWAAGAVTRGPWMRVAAALAYGLWPPFLESVVQARLGAVIAHMAIVLAALGVAHTAHVARGESLGNGIEWRRPPVRMAAAPGASLALAVAVAAQPVLLAPALIGLALFGWRAAGLRSRVLGIGLLPLVVALPTLVAAARHLDDPSLASAILARESGPSSAWSGSVIDVLAGTGLADAWHGSAAGWWLIPAFVVAVLALAALASLASKGAGRAAIGGLVFAGVGALTASWSASTAGASSGQQGSGVGDGWPGAGLSLLAVGLLVAALAAHGRVTVGQGPRHRAARVLASMAAWAGTAAVLAVAALTAWPGAQRGDISLADPQLLPLAVELSQEEPRFERTLVVQQAGQGEVSFTVLTTDGATLLAGGADVDAQGTPIVDAGSGVPPALDRTVGELALSPQADLTMLAAWGIGTIVTAPGADAVGAILDQHEGVSLGSGSERGVTYRIDAVDPGRAWLETSDGIVVAHSDRTSGKVSVSSADAGGGRLVIAVPASSRWSAWAGSTRLEKVDDEYGRMAFSVPPGARDITYEYSDPFYSVYRWVILVMVAVTALGALSWRRVVRVEP